MNRTVHALLTDGTEIVRYDRAGKWYVEQPDGYRRLLTLTEATQFVVHRREWLPGRIGGSAFDRRMTKRFS